MQVKNTVYVLSLLIFLSSIIVLVYSIKTKNNCKYIIIISIIYIIYSILLIEFLPPLLSLSIGLELLIYRATELITIIIFIISIIISNKKSKDLNNKTKSGKVILIILILLPTITFSYSYIKEMYYINNSKLVLVYKEGENFNTNYYAYAINNNYCKKISIGTDFKAYKIKYYLPKEYKKLNYRWSTDNIEIDRNKIIIYRNNKLIIKEKIVNNISTYELEEVYYK